MKIKLFLLTYNNEHHLNSTLESLFESSWRNYFNKETWVINNHSNFNLFNRFKSFVKVIHNNARPDWSMGHPARNWNQALMFGFVNLNQPDADLVITVQDDVLFAQDWLEKLIDAHQTYSYIMDGYGDTLQSWTPAGVKAIGLWDERYVGLAWGEADYQTAAIVFNREKSSITTNHPFGDQWNPIGKPGTLVSKPDDVNEKKVASKAIGNKIYKHICADVYHHKWGFYPHHWRPLEWIAKYARPPKTKQFILYPYFELAVDNLKEKGYLYEEWNDEERGDDGTKWSGHPKKLREPLNLPAYYDFDNHKLCGEVYLRDNREIYGLKFNPTIRGLEGCEHTQALDGSIVRDYNAYGMIEYNRMKSLIDELLLIDPLRCIVEIGVDKDAFAKNTYSREILKNKDPNTIYIGVDIEDRTRICYYGYENVHFIQTDSSNRQLVYDYMNKLGIYEIDFLFIDGYHSINQCVKDWLYVEKLSKHGRVILHDTRVFPGPYAVFEAIDDTMFNKKLVNYDVPNFGFGVAWRKDDILL